MKSFHILALAPPVLLLLGGCSNDAEAGTPLPEEAASEVVVERGAPLTAAVEKLVAPSPTSGQDEGTSGTTAAIQDVAQGLGGVDTAGIAVIGGETKIETKDGVTPITWMDLSLQDVPMEDMLDALLYPDEYEDGEFDFPERIAKHDEQQVAIVGYMIPLEWEETTVPEFMLVRDLMGCCFGGSPQPDEWINVKMAEKGAEYFPYIPVVVRGKFRIDGIEDEAGYAAGCFHIDGVSVKKEL